MTFAEKLRELRDARQLSEAKLARASGLPLATVHNYCLGRRQPAFAAVVKLAAALGVTCEAFAGCEDVQAEEAQAPAPTKTKKAAARKPAAKRKGK
jgi:transcriptional regulator with XRE-family HTH domain